MELNTDKTPFNERYKRSTENDNALLRHTRKSVPYLKELQKKTPENEKLKRAKFDGSKKD